LIILIFSGGMHQNTITKQANQFSGYLLVLW
jgi:hypothetical protein